MRFVISPSEKNYDRSFMCFCVCVEHFGIGVGSGV